MTTNAEQAFWKIWQMTALSWTFLGATGGRFHWPLGAAPLLLLPWNRPWITHYRDGRRPNVVSTGKGKGWSSLETWFIFDVHRDPYVDSRSLFHSIQHCRMGKFKKFLTTHRHIFYETWKNDWYGKTVNPLHFGSDLADIHIRINMELLVWIADHFWLRFDDLAEVCALWALSCCCCCCCYVCVKSG